MLKTGAKMKKIGFSFNQGGHAVISRIISRWLLYHVVGMYDFPNKCD